MRNFLNGLGLWEYLRGIFLTALVVLGRPGLKVQGTISRLGALDLLRLEKSGGLLGARIHYSLLVTEAMV